MRVERAGFKNRTRERISASRKYVLDHSLVEVFESLKADRKME